MEWTPEQITALREKLGFTHEEMALVLAYRPLQTVLNFESGKEKPGLEIVRLLNLLAKQCEFEHD